MLERSQISNNAKLVEQVNDPEFFLLGSQCIELDGVHFCAARQFQLGTRRTADSQSIAMFLGKGRTGLHWQHTVHGARQLAEALIQMADRLEADQASEAQALLTATLSKGKSDGI